MTRMGLLSFMEKRKSFIKNQLIPHRKKNGWALKILNIITVEKAHNQKLHKDHQNQTQRNEMCLKKISIHQSTFTQAKISMIKAPKNYFHQVTHQSQKLVRNSTQATVKIKIIFHTVKNWKNHKKLKKNHKRSQWKR